MFEVFKAGTARIEQRYCEDRDYIRRMFKRLCNRSRAIISKVLPGPLGDAVAPFRYPPVAAGIPVLPVERILDEHEDMMAEIRLLLEGFDQWEQWYVPVIERYAGYVHLLPASEAHHHRGVGGLLAHGLEVGLLTLQQAYDRLYGMQMPPSLRRKARPRWMYSCFVAGLCHDIGKPITTMLVTLEDGQAWDPFQTDLLSWCKSNKTEKYWVSFRDRRVGDHEKIASMAMDQVLTQEDRGYLSEYDPDMLLNLFSTIQKNRDAGHEMLTLVTTADRKSVQRDLSASNLAQDIGPRLGLPTMRIIIDAMRRLVAEGKWEVNQSGGRLWHMEGGLYMAWPDSAKDISMELSQDEAFMGVPRDPMAMLTIMREWRFISEVGGEELFWLSPEILGEKRFQAVRISEPETIIDVMPPLLKGIIESAEGTPLDQLVETDTIILGEQVEQLSEEDVGIEDVGIIDLAHGELALSVEKLSSQLAELCDIVRRSQREEAFWREQATEMLEILALLMQQRKCWQEEQVFEEESEQEYAPPPPERHLKLVPKNNPAWVADIAELIDDGISMSLTDIIKEHPELDRDAVARHFQIAPDGTVVGRIFD